MKILRFIYKGKTGWGILEEGTIRLILNHPFGKLKLGIDKIAFNKVKLLAPACPTKIVLSGLNYKDHAKELAMPLPKEPVIFLKPPTTIISHQENIIYPRKVKRLDYEAELALVIKKEAKNITQGKAKEYILGYTCLNDVTARDLQEKDGQWTRAKSFDTFCPIGPWLETKINPANLKIKSYLNARLVQNSNTAHLIFSPEYLVSFISQVMTLYPGDVVSTGTPPGIGPMQCSDVIEIDIEGIGRLMNRVINHG